MKKLIPILLAVFALVSCEKDPDMDKLDSEYLVFTSHDTSTKFNDSVLIISPTASRSSVTRKTLNTGRTRMHRSSSMHSRLR